MEQKNFMKILTSSEKHMAVSDGELTITSATVGVPLLREVAKSVGVGHGWGNAGTGCAPACPATYCTSVNEDWEMARAVLTVHPLEISVSSQTKHVCSPGEGAVVSIHPHWLCLGLPVFAYCNVGLLVSHDCSQAYGFG